MLPVCDICFNSSHAAIITFGGLGLRGRVRVSFGIMARVGVRVRVRVSTFLWSNYGQGKRMIIVSVRAILGLGFVAYTNLKTNHNPNSTSLTHEIRNGHEGGYYCGKNRYPFMVVLHCQ